jgi:hypothetical protein
MSTEALADLSEKDCAWSLSENDDDTLSTVLGLY